ncbi:flagellar filament capping protein FliD [Rubrivivax sp. JA1026]|uniref:flagellar filament capping protein FliD n=1 Tax=Rubrivivax sp. JA1026 TaxID=2710888 RepID=UPI0013E9011F|nr:flagellar filament capping protein FliD [Rubrivivax sp. JA1026]
MTTSFDPSSMATQLATAYTQNAYKLLSTQSTAAQTTSSALSKLRTALTTFESALSSLSSSKGVKTLAASFDNTSHASATATSKAATGSYSFFVEQVATKHQTSFAALPDVSAAGAGTLSLSIGGSSFGVDLSAADSDGDGQVTASEIARAINTGGANAGRIVASVLNVNGQNRLVLTAAETGAAGAISLDASSVTDGALAGALSTEKLLVQGRDAVLWLGEQGSGVKIEQASNSFTGITGVTVNLTKAMASGDKPVTLTVADDLAATAENVKSFISAYNTLENLLDGMTANATSSGTAAGPFASDSGVLALKSRLGTLLRQTVDGVRLADYGVSIGRDGQMSLDQSKLETALKAKPEGLATVFGSARTGSTSGLLGSLAELTRSWKSADGQIANRMASVDRTQKSITKRQEALDTRYESLYQVYLKQFTKLQELQNSMSSTSSLFSSVATS